MFKKNTKLHEVRTIRSLIQIFLIVAIAISLVGLQTPKKVLAATTVNLTSTGDTYLRQGYPKRNYGGTTTVSVSNGSNKQNSLYKWNLSTIPPGSTVTAASITFYVTDSASVDFSLFSMKRAWVEGTSNDTESTSSANYNTYDGVNSWGTAGAMNTDSDRYNTDLWDATGGSSGTFSTKGLVTIPLNASGITTVQGWVNDPSVNFGVTMQFTGTGVSSPDYWIVASKENTTSGYTAPTLNVTYEAAGPTITTSVSELEPFSTPPGMASAAQTYTLSGVNLTADIVITAPGGFEVSLDNVAWDVTKTLTPSAGTIPSTTIYVRMAGTSEGSFSGDITHTSTGATQKDVTVSGVVTPHYSLSVTAGTGGSVTLDPLGGFYPSGTEVTLTAVPDSGYTFNHWSGDIQSSQNPATVTMDADKTITANFAVSLCSTISVVTEADTHMRSGSLRGSYNYGGSTLVRVNPYYSQGSTDGQLTGALLRWNVSGITIPDGATVDAASITFNVTEGSNNAYSLYNMRRSWVEGTKDGATGTGASWNYYGSGSGSWGTAGAQHTSSDRFNTNLWNATASDFSKTGSVTFDLNTDGLAVVQGWLANPTGNYGLTIQNYGGSAVDVWEAASKENTTLTGPTLNITYCLPTTDPTISISKTSLEPFITQPGVPSAAQSYTVTGANLTEEISVVAPSGFEIASAIDGTYAANLTLSAAGGTVFARLNSSTQGTFSGSIAHYSSDAVAKYVSVEGDVSKQICYTDQEFVSSADLYMSAYNSTYNYGGQTYMRVTLGTSNQRGALVRWDLSGLPDGAVISNPRLQLYVSTAGAATYNLYNMKRAWLEGSGTGTSTGNNGATWATYDGTNAWGTNGAANTGSDRDNTNLWEAGSTSFNSTGSKTVPLNSSGLAVVQAWVDGSLPNYGFTIQNYTSGSTDVQFSTKEHATVANRPRLLLDYCVGANIAPLQPVLVHPEDEATGIATTPTLEVTVEDLDEDPMDVSFYGRPVSETAPAEDFLFIAIPDTQMNAQSYDSVLQAQFAWIANRHTNPGTDNPDLVFVTHLGDLVNTATSTTQWENIDKAFDQLDPTGVPYSVGPGNHDTGTLYSTYFGTSRFTGKSWYQGSYTAGNDNYNNYSFFSAGGMDFIVINLQYSPTTAVLNWADGLLKTHSDRRAIVVQHDLLNVTTNAWSNSATYTALSGNSNLFLMLCGHNHSGSDGSAYRIETRSGMNPVHALLTDYQDLSGQDHIRLLTFKPSTDQIYAQVFSPVTPGGYKTDASNFEQFTMAYDMEGEAGAPFELIGTVNGVASGSNAAINWVGRAENTEYEWYAVASDGNLSTTSSTWSFTTSGVVENQPPVVSGIPNQTISEGETFLSIALDDYVADPDNTDAEMVWTYNGNTDLTVSIDNRVATIGIPNLDWYGSETITFRATDPGSLFGEDSAIFTVTPVNDAPVIIAQAQALTTPENTALEILLTHLTVTDVDNLYPDDFTLTVLSGSNYTISGNTITPTAGFIGDLTVPVKVNDGELDSNTFDLLVAVTEGSIPPVNPSSFYGSVQFVETDAGKPTAGDILYFYLDSETTAITSVAIGSDGTDLNYTVNVPSYPDGRYPTKVTFKLADRVLAISDWHTGTNVELNLHPPKADAGGPYAGLAGDSIALNGTVTDWANDISTYSWDLDGNGVYDDSDVLNPTISFPSAGTYPVSLKAVDTQGGEGYATSQVFALTLSGLTGQVYNGSPHPVTVGGVETPFTSTILYGEPGSATAPTNAGIYKVLVQILSGSEVVAEYETSMEIAKATASVTPNAATKVYGEADPDFTGTLSGFLAADNVTATYSRTAGETVAGGPYTISAVLSPAAVLGNYEITYNTANFTITKKVASVTPDAATKVYGDADPSLTGTLTGFLTADDVTATYSRAAGETVAGSPYTISAVLNPTNVLGNYEITYNTVDFTITKKAASVTPEAATKIYGAADPSLTGTLTGFLTADNVTATYSRTAGETVAGSPYTINAVLSPTAVLGNYEITYNTANFTITKKTASVTPEAATKVYGAADPSFTGTLSGFLPSDSLTATYSRTAGETVAGSPYTISAVLSPTAILGNYEITYNTANFTITKKAASVTLSNLTQTYDGSPKPVTYTTDPEGLNVVITYGGSTEAPINPGSYEVLASVEEANYSGSASDILVISELSHSINLLAGWNLVSFNLTPINPNIEDVLESIEGKYSLVYGWNASSSSSNWLRFDPALGFGNTLTELDVTMGFWIKMEVASTLTVLGTTSTTTDINLYEGWNLIGWPSVASADLPAALAAIASNYDLVMAYHANDTADPWKLFDLKAPGYANDLTAMAPGWGYWINMTAADSLSIEY